MSWNPHLGALGLGISGIILCFVGIYFLRLYFQARRKSTTFDVVTFSAIARYPVSDFGEHWKKQGHPKVVIAVGGFLLFIGISQMIGVVCYVMQFFFGMDMGFPK